MNAFGRLNKSSGFTLAEVLITLGIIGIVAAMTLPSLIGNYKEKVLVTQVKKTYSELQNALKMYAAKNECSDIACISDTGSTTEALNKKLYEQFQGTRFCSKTKEPNCPGIKIKANKPINNGQGQTGYGDVFGPPYFITASGAAIRAYQYNKCPFEYEGYKTDANGNYVDEDNDGIFDKATTISNICAIIYIDANGPNKGPNQFGADVYRFNITTDNKLIPFGSYIQYTLTQDKLNYTPYNIGVEFK